MHKSIVGLVGAAAALTSTHSAGATPISGPATASLRPPRSYAELLEPVPNAVALLKIDDESHVLSGNVERVRFHHHHHHHRHGYFGAYNYDGGFYPRFFLRRRYHHHHHHHHRYFRRW